MPCGESPERPVASLQGCKRSQHIAKIGAMSPRIRFWIFGTILLIVLKLLFSPSAHAQTKTDDQLPAGKIYGEVNLLTNYIENGYTQTEKSWAMQAGLGYKWSQFRMGLWGSTVKFPDSSDDLNLRLLMAYKFIFTTSADLVARYDFNRYYPAGNRNGGIIGLDLNLFKYHVLYEKNSNWENLGEVTRWGFMHDWAIPWNLMLNLNAGYNMMDIPDYSSYFDVKTTVSARYADVNYFIGNSYNSNPGQANGRGDLAFFLGLGAKF